MDTVFPLALWSALLLDVGLIAFLVAREMAEAWQARRRRRWLAKHGRTLLEINAAVKASYKPFA